MNVYRNRELAHLAALIMTDMTGDFCTVCCLTASGGYWRVIRVDCEGREV